MVQLPATAAIEYVAACWVSGAGGIIVQGCFCPGVFCPGALLAGGTFVRGAHARSPQVQCVYAPSRLSVPSVVVWRTNKKRQTRPRSSAGSRAPLPKFSGYVEVEAHYIFHPSTIWVRPLFTELGPKKKPKKPILPWSKQIYVARRHNNYHPFVEYHNIMFCSFRILVFCKPLWWQTIWSL